MTWVDERLAALDLETTSVDPWACMPVSFALCELESDRLRVVHELVNPGIPIPEGATKIHGITDEQVTDSKYDVRRFIDTVSKKLLAWSNDGTPLVGMNLSYDLTIIDRLCRDTYGSGLMRLGWHGPALDCMVLDKAFGNPFRPGSRTLSALCEHHKVEQGQPAHTAKGDCISCLRLIKRFAQKYKGIRVNTPQWLHEHQITWKREQMQSLNEYRVEKGQSSIPEREWEWPIQGVPETVATGGKGA